jgi:uncharacterized protein YndB with AHSA1/START domain
MIKVEADVHATIDKVWNCWNDPAHITNWCFAASDWHAPKSSNDLKVGGKFATTMAAKDGSFSFEFGGEYTAVDLYKHLAYTMGDGRKVEIDFHDSGTHVQLVEKFDPENENSEDMQQAGWQAILNNFKSYCESL